MIQPLRELAKHGHEVTFSNYNEPGNTGVIKYLRTAPENFDVIVGQRFAGYDGMAVWRRSRTPRTRLVYEVDDDMYHIDYVNFAAHEKFGTPEVQDGIKTYSQMSDLVTVTTETLAQVQRDFGVKNVAVLPNCVPAYVLDMPETASGRRPRVGWIGGASHGLDIHEAVPGVRRFLTKNPGWDLYLGGTDYRPSFKFSDWDRMLHVPWRRISDDERGYYELIDFEIGIAPVKDTVFGRSKSALKALEYNARGIPVIASDVQPYREYILHGENGFLVKQPHEWAKYLGMLANDPALRKEMGERGKWRAQYYTHEANWQKWEAAYEGLFSG